MCGEKKATSLAKRFEWKFEHSVPELLAIASELDKYCESDSSRH